MSRPAWCTCTGNEYWPDEHCRHYGVREIETGCNADPLSQCPVCHAAVPRYDVTDHLTWHHSRSDFLSGPRG